MIIYETASQTWNLNKKQNFSPIKIKSNEFKQLTSINPKKFFNQLTKVGNKEFPYIFK